MKTTFTLSLLAFLISQTVLAQRFIWSESAGYQGVANSYNGTVDLCTDQQGNAYVFDYANGNQVCQNQTIQLVASGYNLFLYKFNPNGNLAWGKAFAPGGGGSVTPLNLEMGTDNKLYALVHINGNNIISEDTTVLATSPTNVILCIDTAGNLEWGYPIGYSCPNCLMLEIANDRIYFQSGNTEIQSINFDTTPATSFSFYFDLGTAIPYLAFQGSAVFSNGDLLLAGLQAGDASFIEGDTLVQVDNPFLYRNISYVRLTPELEPVWANTYGYLHDPETHFIPTAVDANDQIYTAWEVLNTISVAGTTVAGDFNNYAGTILSMDENGTPLWLRELESNAALRINYLFADDETDKVWLTGITTSPTTVGDSIIIPGFNGSPFLAAVNNMGEFSRQMALEEPNGSSSRGNTIGKAGSGQYYLGGRLAGNSPFTINCIDNAGNRGLFITGFQDLSPNPPTPVITVNGNLLTANPPFSGTIQWLLNGEIIDGANNQEYSATQNGNYTVTYTYEIGCPNSATSAVQTVTINAIDAIEFEGYLTIYPNPSNGLFQLINIGLADNEPMRVSIKNLAGVSVYSNDNATKNQVIDITNVSAGIYFVNIIQGKSVTSLKLFKQ